MALDTLCEKKSLSLVLLVDTFSPDLMGEPGLVENNHICIYLV